MDPISFGLGLAGEVRHHVTSLKTRMENFKGGQKMFDSLTSKLDLLVQHMSQVDRLLNAVPNAVPGAMSSDFNQILYDVVDSIKNDTWTMPQALSKPFASRSSSAIGKVKINVHQFTRAKALNAEMTSLEMKVEKAVNKLLHLSSVLANSLNSKELRTNFSQQYAEARENHEEIISKIDNLFVAESVEEVYTPMTSTPAPSHTMILDFNSKDEKGNPETPEGVLMQSVLYGESSDIVTAVTGSIKPAYGVLGMAGVGKTVALRGLGHNEEVKKRFHGGVHYMTFGRDATLQTAIGEIASIMTLTGASSQVQNVKSATSLREAVNYAVMWFEGKVCLYLLDDLWPSENLPHGYFHDLRQLLRGSPKSRMVISTRSVAIASEGGRVVDFGPRNPLGNVSVDIFMSHATGQSSPISSSTGIHDLRPSVSKILATCGGLPIALSVTGCAVAKLMRIYGTFEIACDAYAVKLEKKRTLLGDKCTAYGSSLKTAILLSLEHLEMEFLEWVSENSIQLDSSICDLYTSLCVFSNQAWVPLSVLSRMWRFEKDVTFDVVSLFAGMSLATLTLGRSSSELPYEAGIVLHDLQLDFCQRQAVEAEKFSFWHPQLLKGYLELLPQHVPKDKCTEVREIIPHMSLRPWWTKAVTEDGYIHANLSRHLVFSGFGKELAALLLDGRWTQLRRRIGGILALETDFKLLTNVFENEAGTVEISRSFEQIFKAVRLSWGRMVKGLRVFQFHVCGRLANLRKSSAVVDAYLKSLEQCTPKPCLLPVSSFFPDVGSSLIMEIPVGGYCTCVACSPCGRYIASKAGSDIVIAKTSDGEIIQHLQCHKSGVICVSFAGGSKYVVCGAPDGTVMVWKWQLSKTVLVLDGHNDLVTGVCMSSDGGLVFSSSWDGTLRIWDTTTSEQTCELRQSSAVLCVAVCEEDKMVAFGLDNGALKVVDSDTRKVLFEDERIASCVSFSPNGSYLATGSQDKTIRVWNTRMWTRECVRLNGHDDWVNCVSFSPDGKQIASSSYDGTIRVWNVESGKCVGISFKLESGIESVSFAGDGQRIVSGSRDGIVRIWDACLGLESKERIFGHTNWVYGTTISRNGSRVASASEDRTVRLWGMEAENQLGVSLEGHTKAVLCVSFSPDGRKVISGSRDNTLRLWDTGTHKQIGNPFVGHTGFVYSVSFSFDGLRIVSGCSDGIVLIWNLKTQAQLGDALQGNTLGVYAVSESADGSHIVSRDRNRIATIWNCIDRSIVWKSEPCAIGLNNAITDNEAESIIRSCGQQAPHLWPKSFPVYAAALYSVGDSAYTNLLGGQTLLADTLGENTSLPGWSYHTGRNVFTAGLRSGAVAVCKLIIK